MNIKRIVSLVLAAALLMSMVYTGAVISFADEADTYFYSSFEADAQGQTALPLITNQVDEDSQGNARSKGIDAPQVTVGLPGDFTNTVSAVEGNKAHNSNENLMRLIDHDPNTKYLTETDMPINVIYTLAEAQALGMYSIVSANDSDGRDPKTWTVAGSNDKEKWTTLDTREGVMFSGRYEELKYKVENDTKYLYYRLQITAKRGTDSSKMVQFADWNVATGVNESEGDVVGFRIANSTGPSSAWSSDANRGWTGKNALKVSGNQVESDAYSYHVIYDNVNVAVTDKTQLSYMIFPDFSGNSADYDFEYTGMYMSVDLKFTDGTYLSDLNAVDENGFVVSPKAQGESRALYTKSWNHIFSKIGKVASGKVIDKILIAFDKDFKNSEFDLPVSTFFDDITIQEVEDKVYENALSYTKIIRGTESSPEFSRGLCVPSVTYPNGFNFWIMSTTTGSAQYYKYQPGTGNGIEHITISHEASHWIGDRGTFQFMVNTSIDPANVTKASDIETGKRKSEYDRDTMVGQANYLKLDFADNTPAAGAALELTPTDHAASVRFTFDADVSNRNVIFDSVFGNSSNCQIQFNEDGSFSGRTAHTSNGMKWMYFYGTFSVNPSVKKVVNSGSADAIVSFPEGTDSVVMNLATSFMGIEQAKKNLELEIGAKTFEQVYDETESAWLDILNTVEIDTASATEDQLISFYSSLYRLYAYPNHLGENVGTAEQPRMAYVSPHKGSDSSPTIIYDQDMMYNNGFWDTYRTAWAGYALFTPTKAGELVDGFVQHFRETGWVARWICPGGTSAMVGSSSDAIFSDAYMRGIQFDHENAFWSAVKNASVYSPNQMAGGRGGTEKAVFNGYTSTDVSEGMSFGMENAINDSGIANMAKGLGYEDEYIYYSNTALNYTHYFNDEVGFFCGIKPDGTWRWSAKDFSPTRWGYDYCETNAWNMAFTVPFDGQGLANLYGGKANLEAKLDEFFSTKGTYEPGSYNSDIHEMKEMREAKLGQYAGGNQPSHHIVYMYNYANQPSKTQYYAHDVLTRMFVGSSIGQGYLGDEDNGEQSGWYTLSALGFYPVNMGSGNFTISSPLFEKYTLHIEGKDIEVVSKNFSRDNFYIQSMSIDGQPYDSAVISHKDLMAASKIEFVMGSEPSDWATKDDPLDSLTRDDKVAVTKDDMTSGNIVKEIPAANSMVDATYVDTSTNNPQDMFDNDSATYATINGGSASIYSYFASPKIAEMLTITNFKADGTIPSKVSVFGSNDGKSWTELIVRDNLDFKGWARYTKPIAFENETAYKYYRTDLQSAIGTNATDKLEISEIELIGYAFAGTTVANLQAKISFAKKINPNDYESGLEYLDSVIAQAQELAKDEAATEKQLYDMIKKIDDAIANLIPVDRMNKEVSFKNCKLTTNSQDPNHPVENAFDGDRASRWAKIDNVLDNIYVQAEFEKPQTIGRVYLFFEQLCKSFGGQLQGMIQIQTSMDGVNFTTQAYKNSFTDEEKRTKEITMEFDPVETKYLRINFPETQFWLSLFEVSAFAPDGSIYSVDGDIDALPGARRELEVTTTADVNEIQLLDSNDQPIDTSFVYFTENEDGTRLFHVSFIPENTEIGEFDITVVGLGEGLTLRYTATLTNKAYVISAETDADEYAVGTPTTFTVVADENVTSIGLVNESGKFIVKTFEQAVSNGDGTNTWTIKGVISSRGTRTISIYAAGSDLRLIDTGFTVSFTVDYFVSGGDDELAVYSVKAPNAAMAGDVFMLDIKTSTSVSKVGIFSESGMALGKVSQSYVDKNGERCWTIAVKVDSKGERKFTVKATDKTGVWSEGMDFDILIVK